MECDHKCFAQASRIMGFHIFLFLSHITPSQLRKWFAGSPQDALPQCLWSFSRKEVPLLLWWKEADQLSQVISDQALLRWVSSRKVPIFVALLLRIYCRLLSWKVCSFSICFWLLWFQTRLWKWLEWNWVLWTAFWIIACNEASTKE